MRAVIPTQLWIGNARDARNLPEIHEHGVKVVIDLAAEEPPAVLSRDIVYCRFPMLDGNGNPLWLLRSAIDAAAAFIERRVPMLIACSGGMSRSPMIAAAAMSMQTDRPVDECLKEVIGDGPRQVSPALWEEVRSILSRPIPGGSVL